MPIVVRIDHLISLGLLLLLTLAKTECANKVADFTARFVKKMVSNVLNGSLTARIH